jgi:phosphate transport system substrate-binding protein
MKIRAALIFLTLILIVSVSGVAAQDGTIVDVAAADGNFTTFLAAAEAAGLTDTLAGEGSLTVFAPTDEAFSALPAETLAYLLANPDALSQILLYHVVDGAMMSGDVAGGMVASMDMGNELAIAVDDMGVLVDDAHVVTADITASNGVIHAIDKVLVPSIHLDPIIPADVSGDMITAGSSTVGPLSEAIQEQFVSEGYAGEINNSIIGSGAGFERFCVAGETDISNASRAIKDSEIESCAALTPPRTPIELRVGTDALAVVVNPANDFIDSLTTEQLALVFGTATTWADVDPSWPDETILRFIPGTDSGTFDYFVEAIYETDESIILAASNTQLSEDDNVLLEGVANNQYAIGFFGYAYYAHNEDILKILNINDVEPNQANLDAATYPLARPLFIYSDAGIIAAKPQVGQFISYYLTNVNDLIGDVGYFPANPFALNRAKWVIASLLG